MRKSLEIAHSIASQLKNEETYKKETPSTAKEFCFLRLFHLRCNFILSFCFLFLLCAVIKWMWKSHLVQCDFFSLYSALPRNSHSISFLILCFPLVFSLSCYNFLYSFSLVLHLKTFFNYNEEMKRNKGTEKKSDEFYTCFFFNPWLRLLLFLYQLLSSLFFLHLFKALGQKQVNSINSKQEGMASSFISCFSSLMASRLVINTCAIIDYCYFVVAAFVTGWCSTVKLKIDGQ